jgi:TolB-like protein/Flp pilus assembly protein TadD
LDETLAHQRIRDAFRRLSETVSVHGGIAHEIRGDALVAEFAMASDAISASLLFQSRNTDWNAELGDDIRPVVRIGIAIGEVVVADNTLTGEGVVLAQRLEQLADPGGVCVQGAVYDTIPKRLPFVYQHLGERRVKGFDELIRIYAVHLKSGDSVPALEALGRADSTPLELPKDSVPAGKPARSERQLRWRMLLSAAFVAAGAAAVWMANVDSTRNVRDALASLFGAKISQRSSARASIAVMPFSNQSGDPKRDYFSDGVTEDIINALGRFSGVSVMSRNAVQIYKGRPVTPVEIGRALDVRYIVAGSVRQVDDRVRVVVELSEAQTGAQLWSGRYEGAGVQVFEIQDRIVGNIVGALAVKLTHVEQERVFSKPTDSLEAYDLVLRARALIQRNERSANREARSLLARAEELAPGYAESLTVLAEAEMQSALYGWIQDPVQGMTRAEELCKRVLTSADQRAHARAHALIAAVYSHQDRFDEALSHTKRAIELNPSDATALYRHGTSLLYLGRIEEAIEAMETAKRYEPQPSAGTRLNLAIAYYLAERYREALVEADAPTTRAPHDVVTLSAVRAATLAQLGDADEAHQAATQVRRFSPLFDVEGFGTRFANPEHTARLQDGLRRAGL